MVSFVLSQRLVCIVEVQQTLIRYIYTLVKHYKGIKDILSGLFRFCKLNAICVLTPAPVVRTATELFVQKTRRTLKSSAPKVSIHSVV